jgi:hypothetical protein
MFNNNLLVTMTVMKGGGTDMRYTKDGAPHITICATDATSWVIYADGYLDFGQFYKNGRLKLEGSERLSHYVAWGYEEYPQTEEEVLEVMVRALDGDYSSNPIVKRLNWVITCVINGNEEEGATRHTACMRDIRTVLQMLDKFEIHT